MIIVDNSVSSFGKNLDNGIPIIPFYNNSEDRELVHLASYLLLLSSSKNPLEYNRDTFRLREI